MNFKETLRLLPMLKKTNLVPLLLGHTGIGKTELVVQYAASIGYKLIILHVAQLEPSDFIGLYKTTDDGRTMTCPPNWLPYLKGKKGVEVIETCDEPAGHIIFLDEVNRGHEDIRQALYQFLTTKKIHTYEAPPNTFIISAANPASKYECYEFDKALNNRFSHIKFRPEVNETLSYLTAKHGESPFLTWLNTDKGLVELGDDDFEVTDLQLSPRIVENAIILFRELEREPASFQRMALETIMPKDKVASFISFCDEIKQINHVDVINGVKGDKIKALLKGNRRDVLSAIVLSLGKLGKAYVLGVTKIKDEVDGVAVSEKEALANIATFLNEIHAELTTMFINSLGTTYEKKTCFLREPHVFRVLKDKLKDFKEVLNISKK